MSGFETSSIKSLIIVTGIGVLIHPTSFGQELVPEFTISGTSTVRGWTCPVRGKMDVTVSEASIPVPGFPNGLESVRLTVPVQAIDCPEAQMTEHLRETMEESSYPEIVYQLQSYRVIDEDHAVASGILEIHGIQKAADFEVDFVQSNAGILGRGEASINMTDFGIEPPSLWRGLLNVGEIVTVQFAVPLQSPN